MLTINGFGAQRVNSRTGCLEGRAGWKEKGFSVKSHQAVKPDADLQSKDRENPAFLEITRKEIKRGCEEFKNLCEHWASDSGICLNGLVAKPDAAEINQEKSRCKKYRKRFSARAPERGKHRSYRGRPQRRAGTAIVDQ